MEKISPELGYKPEKELKLEDIAMVRTARGSEYTYLPDGRTQRFKKVENKYEEPQSLLVYVPDFDWIQANAPKEMLSQFGENELQYDQMILEYIQNDKDKKKMCYIVDKDGKKIETASNFQEAGQGFLWLGKDTEEGMKLDLSIPVSLLPRIGYYTFDTRKYKDEEGVMKRERHLGNKVVEIIKK